MTCELFYYSLNNLTIISSLISYLFLSVLETYSRYTMRYRYNTVTRVYLVRSFHITYSYIQFVFTYEYLKLNQKNRYTDNGLFIYLFIVKSLFATFSPPHTDDFCVCINRRLHTLSRLTFLTFDRDTSDGSFRYVHTFSITLYIVCN